MASGSFHEDFRRGDDVAGATDRSFGMTFAAVGAAIGLAKLWFGSQGSWIWLAAGIAFLAIASIRPQTLAPLNRLWGRLGWLLHLLVTPLLMLVVFVATVVPVGLAMRALGKDPLRLRRDPAAASYWIERKPPGPAPETMKNQF